MKPIFLDTETTGTEQGDRIIQIAFHVGGSDLSVNALFNPPLPIKIGAMATHHITQEMVAGHPSFGESTIKPALIELLGDGGILIAHNAKFDIGMLYKEGVEVPNYIDTLKIARFLDPKGKIESYSLQYLRYLLELKIEATAHDALGDVMVLELLFNRLQEKMTALYKNDDVIKTMVEISKLPSLLPRCKFKKHKDELWADVAKTDPNYLRWMLNEKEKEKSADDEDLIYTLTHYLLK